MRPKAKSYKFLFVGYERTWNLLEGHQPPSKEKFFEVRSLPGNVFATGATFDLACTELTKQLEHFFAHVGGVDKWYAEALTGLDEGERKKMLEYFFRSDDFKSSDGFQYAPVQDDCIAAVPA